MRPPAQTTEEISSEQFSEVLETIPFMVAYYLDNQSDEQSLSKLSIIMEKLNDAARERFEQELLSEIRQPLPLYDDIKEFLTASGIVREPLPIYVFVDEDEALSDSSQEDRPSIDDIVSLFKGFIGYADKKRNSIAFLKNGLLLSKYCQEKKMYFGEYLLLLMNSIVAENFISTIPHVSYLDQQTEIQNYTDNIRMVRLVKMFTSEEK